MIEETFLVYRWENSDLVYVRQIFIKHLPGQQITKERVLDALTAEVNAYTGGKYRVVPIADMIDFEIKSQVVAV